MPTDPFNPLSSPSAAGQGMSPAQAQQISAQQMQMEEVEEEFSLGEIIATLLEYKWLILMVTALTIILGAAWLFVATPIYRADGLLQIEEQKGGISAFKELEPLMGDSSSVSSQLEILNSRMILGQVVEKLKLDIQATPAYIPLIGKTLARRHEGPDLAEPLLADSKYPWGGEAIKIETLEVPPLLLGESLTLVAGEKAGYKVFDAEARLLLEGRVGEPANANGLVLFVSLLKARPGTQFNLLKTSVPEAISALRDRFTVKERAKQSGVLEATLSGPDAALIRVTLDEVLNTFVRQNVEFRSAEAEKTLKFLEVQLPVLKNQVDTAESAYNNYRQSKGSVDLNIETQSVLQSLVEYDKDIIKIQQERDELRQRFTAEHPTIQAVDSKLERLRGRRGQLNSSVARLPDTQQAILRLRSDLEVSGKLYTELLNTAQQLRVSKAGTVGDARIIDPAVATTRPVEPKKALVMGVSLVLGLLLSVVCIWVLRSLRIVVEDPEKIEKQLGLPVYASIPHSKAEVALARRIKSGKSIGELLAVSQPEDDAVESLRSLRTTIHFALLDAAQGSLLITGPSQGIGKSFLSKNLAAVLAQSGKRVVIVDADLRRGHIHREFGLPREHGVSEYVSGEANLSGILKPTSVPGLTVVTTGQRPPNPSELLMHKRFEELLERLGAEFDTLIVDAPPILAVSDAAIIGRLTGATLMVARAGQHPIRELEQAVKRMQQAGVQVKGFVFNDLDTLRQRYRYGYKGYVYRYSYKES